MLEGKTRRKAVDYLAAKVGTGVARGIGEVYRRSKANLPSVETTGVNSVAP